MKIYRYFREGGRSTFAVNPAFKFFSKLLTVFGMVMMFAVSGWSVCPTGSTSIETWNATAGSTFNNRTGSVQSDAPNYYTITNPVGGQINLTIKNNTANRQLTATLYSDSTCTNAATWTSGEIAGGGTSSATINVTAGVTYYLYLVGSAANQNTDYRVDANKPIKGYSISHENPFTPVFANGGLKLFGDFVATGDSVLCQSNAGGCNNAYNGYLYDTNLIYKNEAGMTLNSASSILTLPANVGTDEIEWAGLYWQGHIADPDASNYAGSSFVQNRGNVTFKLPDGTEQNLSADKVWYHDFWGDGTGTDGGFRSFYQGFKDVTSLVRSHLVNGTSQTFSVGNIKANSGSDWSSYFYLGQGAEYNGLKIGFWGNWSLIVVYKHDPATMPVGTKIKNINVFNGFDAMFPLPIDGYRTFDIEIPMSGFLTPKSGTVNAKMLFYASGGEKLIERDAFYIQNANNAYNYATVSNAANPANNPFNGSVSNLGTPIDAAINYYPGLDLDTYDVSNYMKNNQTSTSLKLEATFSNNNGDQSTPGAIAFSTDLYTPSFCYDYGYEQNGLPFTEENNGTQMPYISGYLPNTADINVSIYLRNQENSDVSANNIMLNIEDINTTQASYKRNSVSVTFADEFTPTAKTDGVWPLNVSDSYIHNIPVGDIDGKQHAYVYYALVPQNSGNISIPIKGTFSYDLVIPMTDGTNLTIPYSSTIGGTGLQMCSVDNFSYTPEWGIFSMVDAGLYDASNANRYYDLTTQVTKRPGNLRIASFDPVQLDTPKPVTTIVAVELIDASQFHDVDAACREPSSAVSPRVWMAFDNNVSQVNFNATTIQNAITKGMVSDVITGEPSPITSAAEFFQTATPNAAFRVSFNTLADQNDSLIHIVQTNQGIRIDNFSNVHQVYPHCRQYVTNPQNNNLTNTTSVACSDNGNNSTYRDVAICMECLYGARTQVLCSRDNFAIRPESFTVVLKDFNQTTGTGDISFTGNTGNIDRNDRENMASGYQYRFDINATNHINNRATPGYSRYFATGGEDYNISLIWEPTSTKTGCNDTNSSRQNFNLIQGTLSSAAKHSQIGEYRLNIIDKTWTAVDWDPAKQTHQTGNHFLRGVECEPDSTVVPSQTTAVGLLGTSLTNRVGCNISSTHTKADGTQYLDHLVTFHPYRFDINNTISYGIGTRPDGIGVGGSGFIYTADMSRDDSMNMSLRASGPIRSVGYDNVVTTNFVTDCYARDLNLTLSSDSNLTLQNAAYQVRFRDFNSTGGLIYDSNATNVNVLNTTMQLVAIDDGNFTKDTAGSLSSETRLNYSRSVTQPTDPLTASFDAIGIACINPTECRMQADLIATHEANGRSRMDFNVTHAYGRIIPRDVRVFGNVPFTANAWYEVFNTRMIGVTSLPPSKNTPDWFTNTLHDDQNYGDGNVTRLQSSVGSTLENIGGDDVNGMETYNFGAVGAANIPYSQKAHIDTAPWLWYGQNALDYLDPSAANLNCFTHPCFNINVVPDIGRAGSATSTEMQGEKANKGTSSGTGVQYDYTPATR